MEKITDIEMLNEYERKIGDGVCANIEESILKLNEAVSMIADLQKISTTLMDVVNEQQHQIDILNMDAENNERLLEERNEYIAAMKAKESAYAAMEMDALKAAQIVGTLQERQKIFEEEDKKLREERELFEKERKDLLQETEEAVLRAERLSKERNDAIKSRDRTVAEKNRLTDKLEEMEEQIRELENEAADDKEKLEDFIGQMEEAEEQARSLTDLVKWYKGYAAATDRKIIDFFKGSKRELENHYNDYLNNPRKLEEIRVHFPEYKNLQKEVSFKEDPRKDNRVKEKGESEGGRVQKPMPRNDEWNLGREWGD